MSAAMKRRQLSDLFETGHADGIRKEVHRILGLISPGFDTGPFDRTYDAVCRLYHGSFPGYGRCNTPYHDLRHALETLLAMARLIHGSAIGSAGPAERDVILALAAAGFHDAGYIPEETEPERRGASFRTQHEARSMDFIERHAGDLGLAPEERDRVNRLIRCTDLSSEGMPDRVPADAPALLGRMMAAADLLAQLSDPVYLEKLSDLYCEDLDSGGRQYTDRMDVLHKALRFQGFFKERLAGILPEHGRLLARHFAERWAIPADLYDQAIESQHAYLARVLAEQADTAHAHLRRRGTAARLAEAFERPRA
jgi:hypothetical protein